MADSKQAITSLLTEHFRYTPLTLIDDIINTVNELVYRAVNAVEEGLSNAPSSSLGFADKFAAEHPYDTPQTDTDGSEVFPDASLEIENGVHQLETLLQALVDKNFDKLEIYVLRNILSIPQDVAPWMRLAHYDNLTVSSNNAQPYSTQQSSSSTAESLYLLRRKLTEARKLNARLQAERSHNQAILAQLHTLVSTPSLAAQRSRPSETPTPSLSFISSAPSAKAVGVSFGNNSSDTERARHSTASTASTLSIPPTPRTKESTTQPLTTHTRFLSAQLPALRQAVAELKERAQVVRNEDGVVRAARQAAAEERREYIETRVKNRLENDDAHGGLAASAAMPLGLSKQRDEEQVTSMEHVASLVSSSSGDTRHGGTASHGGDLR